MSISKVTTLFFLLISFIILLYLANFNIYAYAQVEITTTADNTAATSKAVTSTNDAILKSLVIISQVAVLGIPFNYFFFNRFLDKKRDNNLLHEHEREQNNVYFHIRTLNLKRVIAIVIICCISIIIFSTGSILLKSYQLSQNLDMDILTAFDILDTTSVGQVWILRVVTSSAIIGIVLIIFATCIRRKGTNPMKNENLDKKYNRVNNISNKYDKLEQIFFLGVIALASINLFSNSMVSHSNSLPSFSNFAVSMDWIHFMAVSIWIGGLFYISLVVVKNFKPIVNHNDDKSNNSTNTSKFSNSTESLLNMSIALMYFSFIVISVLCIIGVSGLYLGYVHLLELNSVFNTQYGQILVLKLALAFPLIFIGRYNQLKIFRYASLMSNLLKDKNKTKNTDNNTLAQQYNEKRTLLFKTLNKSIKIESLLGITVLIVAAFLSVTSPPSLEATSQDSFNIQDNKNNVSESNKSFFLYLVMALAIIISAIGIINFRRNQKHIKSVFVLIE
ncbi:MAG: CopD family protein [Candidatus Nitrosocosmicus sp.]|nr:CopD family protein [Candidatus Nitrosocosmicus sp.]MDN5868442.1 CopD family protein [Candidatus Nitrosocosmicus sp.]